MSKVFLTTLLVSLVLFAFSCDPGTSCPSGQILVDNTCVDNTCIDYACDVNQHCAVDIQFGPDCVCNQGTVASHDYSGAHPILICELPKDTCTCTGYNTHCDSRGDCECNNGFLPVHDYSGMHPVLNCVQNPCTPQSCSQYELCEARFDDNQNIWYATCI